MLFDSGITVKDLAWGKERGFVHILIDTLEDVNDDVIRQLRIGILQLGESPRKHTQRFNLSGVHVVTNRLQTIVLGNRPLPMYEGIPYVLDDGKNDLVNHHSPGFGKFASIAFMDRGCGR